MHIPWLSSSKRQFAREPLVDGNAERILITGRTGLGQELFRSHIGFTPSHILFYPGNRTMCHNSNAKVAEQNLVIITHQEIGRFDISVDDFVIVGILQSLSDLFHIGNNGCTWKFAPAWMTLVESTMCCVSHSKKRYIL